MAGLLPGAAAAQFVTADGGTPTVVIDAGAPITVQIAPADSAGVSQNTFSRFSVPVTGVDLDNQTAGASLIVNEVTSTTPTEIEGPLTVLGDAADVVIANPNGITVNGGQFINTGNTALTTGQIGRDAQDRVTTSVTGGAITLRAGGLSGTMAELALISQSLRVEGPVSGGVAHLNILTGQGTVDLDRERNGFGQDGAGVLPWAQTDGAGGVSGALVVDITEAGQMEAGRISVTVTDQGAGVRVAGDQLATVGGFQLTTSGQLEVLGSEIAAEGSVLATAGSVDLQQDGARRARLASETQGVTVEATSGGIDLGVGQVSGRLISADSLSSLGGVTLVAAGDITSAAQDGLVAELTSDIGTLDNIQTGSSVALLSQGALRFDGLRVAASDDFRATSSGPLTFAQTIAEVDGDLRLFSNADVSLDAAQFTAQSDFVVQGTALRIGGLDADQARSELVAVNGGGVLQATSGDVLNYGSLLQGNTTPVPNNDGGLGALTILAAGDVVNRSLSVDRLAVAFGQDTALFVDAGGDVINDTGRLFSNADLTVQAGGDLVNRTLFTTDPGTVEVTRQKGARYAASLFLKREQSTHVKGDFGGQSIEGEQSFVLAIGDVTVTADNILSTGAEITGANVSLTAADQLVSDMRQIGQVAYVQTCRLFCKVSGSSSLRQVGGGITASDTLTLTAGGQVSSTGGSFTGQNGIAITAPLTVVRPVYTPQLVSRPAGVMGGFHGAKGRLIGTYRPGFLNSSLGALAIDGDTDLGGTEVLALGGVVITGTQVQSLQMPDEVIFKDRPLGFFWNILR